ncbi:hypothetical protein THIOSC15_1110005 [uncultured Thiomicrorhabdus sp.]
MSMPDLIDSNEHKRLLDFAGLQEQAADEEDYLVVEHRK